MNKSRREMGSLETEVLSHLWAADEPVKPSQVLEAMHVDLAYTTIMTILTRLCEKGLARRERRGRAYVYWPVVSEADLTAKRMYAHLKRAGDRQAVLSQFVTSLGKRDERALRRILDETEAR